MTIAISLIPDLVPLRITADMVEDVRKSLPELPAARQKRFVEAYGLTEYDAHVLTSEKSLAEFFEETLRAVIEVAGVPGKDLAKDTTNWIMVELRGLLNRGKAESREEGVQEIPIANSPVSPKALAALLSLKRKGEISGPTAKAILEEMFNTGKSAEEIVQAKGLTQVSDEAVLEGFIDEVMARNPAQLAQYRSGKDAVFGFFVGQVMKASGGKANPAKVNDLLKRKLTP